MDEVRVCWKCRMQYPASTVVCVRCGVNLVTGEDLQPGPEPEIPAGWGARLLGTFPGLLRPVLLLGSAVLVLVSLSVLWLGFFLFGQGIWISAISVMAVGLIMYAQAVVWLLRGELELIHVGLAEFQEPHWTAFIILVFGPFALGVALLKWLGGPPP